MMPEGMSFDERNRIHGVIEPHVERVGLEVETGGGRMKQIGDVVDAGDAWEVPIVVRIPKRFIHEDERLG